MTPYHETFLPIFLGGCLVAVMLSTIAGRLDGWGWALLLLPLGILAFWAAVFFGSDMGYRAWQSMPDPPDEAFSDASVMGALILGWLPGGILCLAVFSLVRGVKLMLRDTNPQ